MIGHARGILEAALQPFTLGVNRWRMRWRERWRGYTEDDMARMHEKFRAAELGGLVELTKTEQRALFDLQRKIRKGRMALGALRPAHRDEGARGELK